jgi:hypothetical protein
MRYVDFSPDVKALLLMLRKACTGKFSTLTGVGLEL